MKNFARNVCMFSTLVYASVCFSTPNIVLIIADDVGAQSCNLYGADEDLTPNIDSIAEQGMRLENFYAYTVCSPTRASLMTGRNSDRHGVKAPVNATLSTNETTLANILQDAGYTTGVFEKWNLAGGPAISDRTAYMEIQGWDTNYTFKGPSLENYTDNPAGETNYWPYIYNQEAVQFIDDHAGDSSPFFMLYGMALCHSPYGATPLDPEFTGTDSAEFQEMLKYSDVLVSNVLAIIDSEGIASNTVVIYFGDNGTPSTISNNFQGVSLLGKKGTYDERGSWVPFYVRWPGYIPTNSTYSGITQVEDLFNTIAEIGSAEVPIDRLIDGRSFLDKLYGGSGNHRNTIYLGDHSSTIDDGHVQNLTHKRAKVGGVSYLFRNNKPYGDETVTETNQVDLINNIWLDSYWYSTTNKTFGDTPWGGYSNEVIFLSNSTNDYP